MVWPKPDQPDWFLCLCCAPVLARHYELPEEGTCVVEHVTVLFSSGLPPPQPWESKAESFLGSLAAHPSAVPFLQAVDTKVYEVRQNNCVYIFLLSTFKLCHPLTPSQDYSQVVRRPMHLSLVRSTLRRGDYTVPRDFIQDIRLIFDNSRTYNSKRTEVVVPACSILTPSQPPCPAPCPTPSPPQVYRMTTELQTFFDGRVLEFLRACQDRETMHGTRGTFSRLAISTGDDGAELQLNGSALGDAEREEEAASLSPAQPQAVRGRAGLRPRRVCVVGAPEERSEADGDESYTDDVSASPTLSSASSTVSTNGSSCVASPASCQGKGRLLQSCARDGSGSSAGLRMTLRPRDNLPSTEAPLQRWDEEREMEEDEPRGRRRRRKRSGRSATSRKRLRLQDMSKEEEGEGEGEEEEEEEEEGSVWSGRSTVATTSRGRVVKRRCRFT